MTTAESASTASSAGIGGSGSSESVSVRDRGARMRVSSRTGFSLEPGLARNEMSPASESGRSWFAACSTPSDATMQMSIAAVAPIAAHTRCMSWNRLRISEVHDSCSSMPQPLDHLARQPLGFGRAAIGQPLGGLAQRRPHLVELRGDQRAGDAIVQVALNGDALLERQLVVVELLEPVLHVLAADGVHHGRVSRSWTRSACRARVSRDFTVPTATPSEKAISS